VELAADLSFSNLLRPADAFDLGLDGTSRIDVDKAAGRTRPDSGVADSAEEAVTTLKAVARTVG
jgi:hypothetical protein